MKLLWIHLPGMSAATELPENWPPPTQRAQLVAGFPWWPASVYASLRTGRTPAEHGVLRPQLVAEPDELRFEGDLFARAAGSTRIEEVDEPVAWLDALRDSRGVDLLHLRATASWVDDPGPALEQLAEALRESTASGRRVVLSGDRPLARRARGVAFDALPTPAHTRRCEVFERVALYQIEGGRTDPDWRDAVLELAAVERVLEGRGLELFGAAADDRVALILTPDRRFAPEGDPNAASPPSTDEPDRPVLWAWSDAEVAWPDAAHDYRLAATLLAALDGSSREARLRGADAPLPLSV